ncbi:MAG: 16S rRNA methyltransferase [Candidatus Odinarchaeum yellowstonii]|uniref:Ribosomal RNA small subunit methyltransferase Nep1 n=1 Tax=Odinarchaeota yellowstonii (strain LCB_4) TaxID=1841599 RepID=A0AAF0D347_ODILC|nr:MAG: 16S rRNA methyltransferase [Candidatus Odinarchaeum yellowstonii]
MFYLIFAEAALETIPREIWNHPAVKLLAKKTHKKPGKLILDSSYLYQAMKELEDFNKRGRPDIIHFCLLYALGSELNLDNMLRIFVHTVNDQIIRVNPSVRLPRNYPRFIGLMEQLFEKKVIADSKGEQLLSIYDMKISDLISELKPDSVILLQEGKPMLPRNLIIENIRNKKKLAFIVGAFPHGCYRQEISKISPAAYSISKYTLDTWNAIGKLISICEDIIADIKGEQTPST